MPMVYLKLFYDQVDALAAYSNEEVGRLIRGAVCYARDGEQPVFTGNERFIWPTLKASIDRTNAEYDNLCKTRQECGAMGGRPKKAKGFLENQKNLREEKEKEQEKEVPPPTPSQRGKSGGSGATDYVNTYISAVDDVALGKWLERLPPEIVTHAADEACANGVARWPYMVAILKRYERQNIRTLEEARASDGSPSTAATLAGNLTDEQLAKKSREEAATLALLRGELPD